MKTIEERAREYADTNYPPKPLYYDWEDDGYDEGWNAAANPASNKAFIAGAESEHAHLTRWNDPEEAPENSNEVLIKFKDRDGEVLCNIAFYQRKWITPYINDPIEIIGWREIHQ